MFYCQPDVFFISQFKIIIVTLKNRILIRAYKLNDNDPFQADSG